MVGLSLTFTAIAIAVFGCLYLVISCYLNYRRVPNVKGPFLACISPLWLLYHTLKGDTYLAAEAAFKEYGSLIRVAPDYVITNDVEVAKRMYSRGSNLMRGRWYDAMRLGADQDNVMTITDEKAHASMRAKLIPGYTGRETGFEAAVDRMLSEMIALIRRDYVEKDAVMDFARIATFFTLDVLTKVAFDLEIGFLKENKDHYDYQKALTGFLPIMDLCCNHPTIFKILNSKLVLSLTKPKPEDKIGQGALIGQAHKAVAEYFKDDEKDNVDSMIASFKRHGVTQTQCQDETMLAILAGSDSTSTALRMAFLHVITNPRVYSKLNKEIQDAVERGVVSFPIITMSEAQALPYLCAVIKEASRCFAPLHGLSGRCSNNVVEINGQKIPPNTQVGVAWYSLARTEEIYGKDAAQFRPERWLEADAETLKRYENGTALFFGYGTSICLGKNLALMELHKGLFEVS